LFGWWDCKRMACVKWVACDVSGRLLILKVARATPIDVRHAHTTSAIITSAAGGVSVVLFMYSEAKEVCDIHSD